MKALARCALLFCLFPMNGIILSAGGVDKNPTATSASQAGPSSVPVSAFDSDAPEEPTPDDEDVDVDVEMNTLDLAMMLECLGPFEGGPALYSSDCGFGGHSPEQSRFGLSRLSQDNLRDDSETAPEYVELRSTGLLSSLDKSSTSLTVNGTTIQTNTGTIFVTRWLHITLPAIREAIWHSECLQQSSL